MAKLNTMIVSDALNSKILRESARAALTPILIEESKTGTPEGDTSKAILESLETGIDFEPKMLTVAQRLDLYYQTTVEIEKLMRCQKCKCIASKDLDVCPYCGDGGDADGDDIKAALVTPTEVESAAPQTVTSQIIDEVPAVSPEKSAEKKVAKADKNKKSAEKKVAKADKNKKVAAEKADIAETPLAQVISTPTELVTSATEIVNTTANAIIGLTEPVCEGLLNEVITHLKVLTESSRRSYWRIGRTIKAIFDRELWRTRVDSTGTPMYETFNQFAELELGLPYREAYERMDVAAAVSEEQLTRIGYSKVLKIIRAPKDQIPLLMAEAESGATRRDLEAKVAAGKKQAGLDKVKRNPEGRKAMPMGKPGALTAEEKAKGVKKTDKSVEELTQGAFKAAAEGEGKITLAMVAGARRIELFKTPAKGEKLVPAQSIDDMPIGRYELENSNVVLLFALVRGPRGLALKLEVKRG